MGAEWAEVHVSCVTAAGPRDVSMVTMSVRETLEPRLRRWRTTTLPIVQAALAAGLSWLVAVKQFEH